jgi:Flp pilus assembly protein TadD
VRDRKIDPPESDEVPVTEPDPAVLDQANMRGRLAEIDIALGIQLLDHGDLAGAEKAFVRARSARSVEATFYLGRVHHLRGDHDRAEKALVQASDGGSLSAMVALGVLREERSDIAGALVVLKRADEMGSSQAAGRIGIIYAKNGI